MIGYLIFGILIGLLVGLYVGYKVGFAGGHFQGMVDEAFGRKVDE